MRAGQVADDLRPNPNPNPNPNPSPSPDPNPNPNPNQVKWQTIFDLPFDKTMHLHNPLNENKPVKIGRDGQASPNLAMTLTSAPNPTLTRTLTVTLTLPFTLPLPLPLPLTLTLTLTQEMDPAVGLELACLFDEGYAQNPEQSLKRRKVRGRVRVRGQG